MKLLADIQISNRPWTRQQITQTLLSRNITKLKLYYWAHHSSECLHLLCQGGCVFIRAGLWVRQQDYAKKKKHHTSFQKVWNRVRTGPKCSLKSFKCFWVLWIQQSGGHILLRHLVITPSQNNDPLRFELITPFPGQWPSDVLLGQ